MNTEETNDAFADFSVLVAPDDEKGLRRVYEIGYHIIPTVAEEDVEAEARSFVDAIRKNSTEIIGERAPSTVVPLAYAIEKKIDGARRLFESAYFGWVAFEAEPAAIAKINEIFKTHGAVLRHLTITTSRDAVAATLADPSLDAGGAVPQEHEAVSEEELDEALENIEKKEEV